MKALQFNGTDIGRIELSVLSNDAFRRTLLITDYCNLLILLYTPNRPSLPPHLHYSYGWKFDTKMGLA
jgi:hypothetical protein